MSFSACPSDISVTTCLNLPLKNNNFHGKHCIALGCSNYWSKTRGLGISCHNVPCRDKSHLKTGSHAAFGRQNADDTPYWPKNPSDAHVCSMQFVTGKPNSGLLHPDFVPHLFSFTPVHEHEHARASLQRYSKMQERYQAGSFSHHMKPHPQ